MKCGEYHAEGPDECCVVCGTRWPCAVRVDDRERADSLFLLPHTCAYYADPPCRRCEELRGQPQP